MSKSLDGVLTKKANTKETFNEEQNVQVPVTAIFSKINLCKNGQKMKNVKISKKIPSIQEI